VQPLLQWKKISITYSKCVSVVLGFQHAMRMRHLSSVACPIIPYFPNYLVNGTIFVGGGGSYYSR